MKLLRVLSAASAALLLTASLAGACGEKKSHGEAQLTSGGEGKAKAVSLASAKSGCAKGAKADGVMLTSGGGCAKGAKGAKADGVMLTGGGGCAKGMKADGSGGCKKGGAMSASGGGCEKAKMAGGCCAKKAAPVMASIGDTTDTASCQFKAGSVNLKGTVVCKHCDLKQGESCATMFQTESGCLIALTGDKAAALREAAVGGSKLVRVKGDLASSGDLTVSSFRVVRSLDSGASAM